MKIWTIVLAIPTVAIITCLYAISLYKLAYLLYSQLISLQEGAEFLAFMTALISTGITCVIVGIKCNERHER